VAPSGSEQNSGWRRAAIRDFNEDAEGVPDVVDRDRSRDRSRYA